MTRRGGSKVGLGFGWVGVVLNYYYYLLIQDIIKIEGTYRGGQGTTTVTTACPEDR